MGEAAITRELVRLEAADRPALTLTVRSTRVEERERGLALWLDAAGAATGWATGITLQVTAARAGETLAVTVPGSSCLVTYLEDGRATSAEFIVASGTGSERAGTRTLDVTARKRFAQRADAAPYAAALPDELRLVWSSGRAAGEGAK